MSADAVQISEWAERWARGVKLAQPYADARRRAAQTLATENRRRAKPCGIRGCKRSGGKRGLCRDHYAMVPGETTIECCIAVLRAQMAEATKWHRKYVRIVQKQLDESRSDCPQAIV